MKRGHWRDQTAGEDQKRSDKTIGVRLTAAELSEFDAQIAELGLKRSNALRICARRVGGFVELDPDSKAELKALGAQMRGIATNINQIAKAANRTGDPKYGAFMDQRAKLGPVMVALESRLEYLLHLGNRRESGRERLKDQEGS